MFYRLFFLSLFFSFVCADEIPIATVDTLNPTIDKTGSQASTIHGCVNVISGGYHEGTLDLSIPGQKPLNLTRSYSSSTKMHMTLAYGWNFDTLTWCNLSRDGSSINFQHLKPKNRITYFSDYFGVIQTAEERIQEGTTNYPMNHGEESYLGWCLNDLSHGGNLSRSNLKYNVHDFSPDSNKEITITDGSGRTAHFQSASTFSYQRKRKYKAKEQLILPIQKILQPDNYQITFDWMYEYGKKEAYLLQGKKAPVCQAIRTHTPSGDVYAEFTFDKIPIYDNGQFFFGTEVKASHGSKARYHLYREDTKNLLNKVELFGAEENLPYYTCEYDYLQPKGCKFPKIHQKIEPQGRYLKINYYQKGENYAGKRKIKVKKDDPILGRVKNLRAPAGPLGKEETLYTFIYDFEDSDPARALEGIVNVYNSLGGRELYSFSFSRLKGQLTYLNDQKYRNSSYSWSKNGFLGWKTVSDVTEKRNIKTIRKDEYNYDRKNGNLIEEKLTGDLTGNQVDDTHTKKYTYIDNGQAKNLLQKVQEGEKITTIDYLPNSNLPKQITEKAGSHKRIQTFSYDKDNIVIRKTVQDETGNYCKIEETQPENGLPKILILKYWNPQTKVEEPAIKTVFTYNKEGRKTEKQVYSYENGWNPIQTFSWEYNQAGKVTQEINPDGLIQTFQYDPLGNLIEESNGEITKRHIYDAMDRKIQTIHKPVDMVALSEKWSYDALGNQTSHTDIYGRKTETLYDTLSRPIEIILPENCGTEKMRYNVLDQLIEKEDPAGNITKYSYTIRGNITSITHPDQTTETKRYDIEGRLLSEIDPEGVEKTYQYDPLGRITDEKWIKDGVVLKKITNSYNAFFKLSTTENDTRTTNYIYNHKGQLVEKRVEEQTTTYQYDTFGRKTCTQSPLGTKEMNSYDTMGRLIHKYQLDPNGNTLFEETFSYDRYGRKISQTKIIDGKKHRQSYSYDSMGNLTKTTDYNGITTYTIEDYDSSHPTQTTISANGVATVTHKDALNRLSSTKVYDLLGNLIQHEEYEYDLAGNETANIYHVYQSDQLVRTVINRTEYDSCGRPIHLTEAERTPEQKSTRYSYDSCGRKTTLQKPDGTIIYFAYDPLGNLAKKWDDKKSLSYTYHYDNLDRVIAIQNDITGDITNRAYDIYDNPIQETQENGYTIERSYDLENKLTDLTLPDQSEVAYLYEGPLLKTVQRKNSAKELQYQHTYHYDSQGRVIAERNPLQAGETTYTFDAQDHWQETTHPSLHIKSLGYNPVYELKGLRKNGKCNSYQYDSLGQLTEENSHTYSYDSLYNRTSKDSETYTLNSLNQLLSQSNTRYSYDLNGNLIAINTPNKKFYLSYDTLDRLVSVQSEEALTTYHYDGFNRRLSKTANGITENYIYDGKRELGTFDTLRILGQGAGAEIGATVAIETNGRIIAPLHDPFGHITTLLDAETGNPLQHLDYTAFGECTLKDNDENILSLSESLSPWQLSSKRYDIETGFTLYGLRYYAPDIGRWVTPDPAGFEDGPNLYTYVRNSPLVYTDLYGLWILPFCTKLVSAVAPVLLENAVVGLVSAVCPPAGAALKAGITCYRGYQLANLAAGAACDVGGAVVEGGFEAGLELISEKANGVVTFVTNMSPEDIVIIGTTSYLGGKTGNAGKGVTKGARTLKNPPTKSQTLIKTNNVTQQTFNGVKSTQSSKSVVLDSLPKKKGRTRLGPNLDATGAHSSFIRDPVTGTTSKYISFRPQTNTYNPNPWEVVKRFDMNGEKHFNKITKENIQTPHIHEFNIPGGVRRPEQWEIP